MVTYPAALLAVAQAAPPGTIFQPPGITYHIHQDDLETVLVYLDEHTEDLGATAREFVKHLDSQNFHTVLYTLESRSRECLEYSSANRIILELTANCYKVDPTTEGAERIHLCTFHPLKLEPGLG
jgi:hypothetical protein